MYDKNDSNIDDSNYASRHGSDDSCSSSQESQNSRECPCMQCCIGKTGPRGCPGPAGPRGCPGAMGATGATGERGATGATGERGERGEMGATGATGPAGPAGATGATGSAGPAGERGATGPAGPAGATGATGSAGPAGERGATGATGATGPAGPAGAGTIIPYASGGQPFTLSSLLGGNVGLPVAIGFGNNFVLTKNLSSTIDLSGTPSIGSSFAFSMPRDGTIKSFEAFYSNWTPQYLDGTYQVVARLYRSSTPSDIFTPIPGALIELTPAFSGQVLTGDIATGSLSGLSINVTRGTRILLVYYLNPILGTTNPEFIGGYASAGITIE